MQDAFWNNIHSTNLFILAALDVILNILQKISGQDLKVRGVPCEIVYQMHENLLRFCVCKIMLLKIHVVTPIFVPVTLLQGQDFSYLFFCLYFLKEVF